MQIPLKSFVRSRRRVVPIAWPKWTPPLASDAINATLTTTVPALVNCRLCGQGIHSDFLSRKTHVSFEHVEDEDGDPDDYIAILEGKMQKAFPGLKYSDFQCQHPDCDRSYTSDSGRKKHYFEHAYRQLLCPEGCGFQHVDCFTITRHMKDVHHLKYGHKSMKDSARRTKFVQEFKAHEDYLREVFRKCFPCELPADKCKKSGVSGEKSVPNVSITAPDADSITDSDEEESENSDSESSSEQRKKAKKSASKKKIEEKGGEPPISEIVILSSDDEVVVIPKSKKKKLKQRKDKGQDVEEDTSEVQSEVKKEVATPPSSIAGECGSPSRRLLHIVRREKVAGGGEERNTGGIVRKKGSELNMTLDNQRRSYAIYRGKG